MGDFGARAQRHGQTERSTLENGLIISEMAWELSLGLTHENTQVNGMRIRYMVVAE